MKYVILIHSNPQPWGHPTGDFVAEFQALPQAQRERMNAEFEQMLTELSESGELLGGAALVPWRVHGSTAGKREARWSPMGRTGSGEHLAASSRSTSRARSAPRNWRFAGPGDGRAAPRHEPGRRRSVISRELEDVWRRESPYVLGALLRRHGDLGDCEDAAQEALVAAAEQWARDGVPRTPGAGSSGWPLGG